MTSVRHNRFSTTSWFLARKFSKQDSSLIEYLNKRTLIYFIIVSNIFSVKASLTVTVMNLGSVIFKKKIIIHVSFPLTACKTLIILVFLNIFCYTQGLHSIKHRLFHPLLNEAHLFKIKSRVVTDQYVKGTSTKNCLNLQVARETSIDTFLPCVNAY
jgi:hypothetical protein